MKILFLVGAILAFERPRVRRSKNISPVVTSQSDDVTCSVGERTMNQRNNYSLVLLLLCRWRRRKMCEAKGYAKMGRRGVRERVQIFIGISCCTKQCVSLQGTLFHPCGMDHAALYTGRTITSNIYDHLLSFQFQYISCS